MNNTKLIRFVKQMQIELEHNQHKGSIFEWKDFDTMIAELEYHKSKMLLAIRSNNKGAVKEYLADCANILLAIGNLGGLYDEDTIDNQKCFETMPQLFKEVSIDDINTNVKNIGGRYQKEN